MEYMNYYNLCRENAEKGLYFLMNFLESHNDLIYTREENENIISIDIETWDKENYNSEFLMCCEFDKFGDFIE